MVGVYPYAIAQAAVRLSSTPCPTSRQFHTDAGDAENRGAVVATQPAAGAGQDPRGQPRPLRRVSDRYVPVSLQMS